MVVILLGPPGVGKGTQGARLAEALEWERIATGDLLRAARREGSELGRKAQDYMDAGDLVPDELIVALVRERLEALPSERGVLFDGFPRTRPQAEALDRVLPAVGRRVDGVVLLEAPDEVLVKRLSGRRSCPQCERIFNVHFDPPVSEDICDECGARLTTRRDDAPDTVRRRLEVYREATTPVIAHYDSGPALLLEVDGNRAVNEVEESLRNRLAEGLGAGA